MKTLHVDHGSPMNALAKNTFTETLWRLWQELRDIQAIYMNSAHWINRGHDRIIGSHPHPPMIYDMYGFPPELYEVEYPVSIERERAEKLQEFLEKSRTPSRLDPIRGIDHGIWSVLIHIFPEADIPIVPISVPYDASPKEHFEFWRLLSEKYREDDILYISSGNIVHNLSLLDWSGTSTPQWAKDFDEQIEKIILSGIYEGVINYRDLPGAHTAVPTPDHFYPFVSFLGASEGSPITSIHHGFELGSISRRIYKNF